MNIIKILDAFSKVKDISIVAFMVVSLYLNANYVSTKTFDAYELKNTNQHVIIQTALISIDKTLALQVQNQTLLTDAITSIKINTGRLGTIEDRIRYFDSLDLSKFIRDCLIEHSTTTYRITALETKK